MNTLAKTHINPDFETSVDAIVRANILTRMYGVKVHGKGILHISLAAQKGFNRAFDFSNKKYVKRSITIDIPHQDAQALFCDWREVGNDIRGAEEQSKRLLRYFKAISG